MWTEEVSAVVFRTDARVDGAELFGTSGLVELGIRDALLCASLEHGSAADTRHVELRPIELGDEVRVTGLFERGNITLVDFQIGRRVVGVAVVFDAVVLHLQWWRRT